MSANEIEAVLPSLSEPQRRRALEIKGAIEALQAELEKIISKPESKAIGINLRERGISEEHAAEIRARLKSFAEDWDRPEAAVYDEAPTR